VTAKRSHRRGGPEPDPSRAHDLRPDPHADYDIDIDVGGATTNVTGTTGFGCTF